MVCITRVMRLMREYFILAVRPQVQEAAAKEIDLDSKSDPIVS
jgi:hypothetical protein